MDTNPFIALFHFVQVYFSEILYSVFIVLFPYILMRNVKKMIGYTTNAVIAWVAISLGMLVLFYFIGVERIFINTVGITKSLFFLAFILIGATLWIYTKKDNLKTKLIFNIVILILLIIFIFAATLNDMNLKESDKQLQSRKSNIPISNNLFAVTFGIGIIFPLIVSIRTYQNVNSRFKEFEE